MSLPDFLVVGAEKAGTRTLNGMLSAHPDIFMSPQREPKFFTDANWERGVHWYASLFAEASVHQKTGETSPAYTWYPEIKHVPKRISETLGDIKYIYIVRHPVERLISHYHHGLFCRWYDESTSMEELARPGSMIYECSRYYQQISQYLSYTNPEQWLVVALENLNHHPDRTQHELFSFIGVDPSAKQEEVQSANMLSGKRQMPGWYTPIRRGLQPLRRLFPQPVRRWMHASAAQMLGQTLEKNEVSADFKQRMLESYREDVVALSEFTGYDYTALWEMSE